MQDLDMGKATLNWQLLTVLNMLFTVKHISRAAESLGVGQPKVSRDLKKLREIFDDPLLVNSPSGYALSARAERLQVPVKQILEMLEDLFCREVYDAASYQGVLNICGPVLETAIFMPDCFYKLKRQAPGLRLNIVSASAQKSFMFLGEGRVHFALSSVPPKVNQDQYYSKLIAASPVVGLLRQTHPLAGKPLLLDEYLQVSHGTVTRAGEKYLQVDAVLAKMGLVRQVTVSVPGFDVAASFCESSDLIVLMPELIARHLIKGRALAFVPLPDEIKLPEVEFRLYWHSRYHQHPMCNWVRTCL